MSMSLITRPGFERLKNELDYLKNIRRPEVITQISEARALGDLKENSEYHTARSEQAIIEGKISELEGLITSIVIVDVEKVDSDLIEFGAKVRLLNLKTEQEMRLQVVSAYESDIASGLFSVNAPIVKALMGKSQGEQVSFNGLDYEILEVSYK
jgi:transcription elongation factor GreA